MRSIMTALCFVLATVSTFTEPAGALEAPAPKVTKTTKGPVITSATIIHDLANGEHRLTITGQNFDVGGGPIGVIVDGMVLPLSGAPTATEIQAALPLPNTLPPGSYVLMVSTGPGPKEALLKFVWVTLPG